MSDERKDGPEYISTKQLPRVEVPVSQMDAVLLELRTLREESKAQSQELRADIHLVANDLTIVKDRVRVLERRQDESDDRARNQSERVRGESRTNEDQNGAIAKLVVDVEALAKVQETQLAILTRLDSVAANPMVRRVAYVFGSAVLAYLASKGWIVR